MDKTVLVTGGSGYIGSHVSLYLMQKGYKVIILDRKPYPVGLRKFILDSQGTYIQADYGDNEILREIFEKYSIGIVVHCAGYIEVAESIKDPLAYYANNIAKSIQLLKSMVFHGISRIVFSSSCSVYGSPNIIPIPECHPTLPLSPYGMSKAVIERMLEDCARAYGLSYVILRYFNAAGATPEYGLGELHEPESHLIPLILKALEEQRAFTVFGNDYATPDGTCIRDYIHVWDIAQAHEKAISYLDTCSENNIFNLGSGKGYSVLEVIQAAELVSKVQLHIKWSSRRDGDAPVLLADTQKANDILRWQAQYSNLEIMITSAYCFMKTNSQISALCRVNDALKEL
ncbi:MAG TPA: UDP-glucose 4-epimerase GalE [Candidatus Babeliaceae bacterium]|nr:UDP-glucose 4-epimerase GalE [Candidatus Babeliaceae bacterium]